MPKPFSESTQVSPISHSWIILHQVPPEKFEAFIIPVEQDGIVLLGKLKCLDGLSNHSLDVLIS